MRLTLRILALVLTLGLLGSLGGALTGALPAGASTEGDEWTFLDLANQERSRAGLAPLAHYGPMRDLARYWAGVMANQNRLYHNPSLSSDIAVRAPDWQRGGENVGYGYDVGSLHQAFMNSPGHRANVLGDFNYVGVGVVQANGTTWVTFDFLKAPAGKPALTSTPAPAPTPSLPVTRISGASEGETSLAVSRQFPAGASNAVVVGRTDVFADALAGGPLAAVNAGPVLLTSPGALSGGVLDEARRVLKPGGTVYLLGGPTALSPGIEASFAAAGLHTARLAGADRFETAVAIARRVNPTPSEVLVVSGAAFADAMVAGTPAGVFGHPIVLTAPGLLPAPTATYLATVPTARRTIVGGPAAVSDSVAALTGASERVWGMDRYETSVRVAQRWFGSAQQLSFATGVTFQDALAGSPFSARGRMPVVLASSAPGQATRDYVRSRLPALVGTVVYGTPSAVSDGALGSLLS